MLKRYLSLALAYALVCASSAAPAFTQENEFKVRYKGGTVLALGQTTDKAAASGQQGTVKGKYQNIEVAQFDAVQGVEFPAENLTSLTDEVVAQIQKTKRFKQVWRTSETPSETNAPALKLIGTVTKVKKGSRAKRYFIGFGAGATKVTVHIKVIDAATGQELFARDEKGSVYIGIFGGKSSGATSKIAKKVAKGIKKYFF